MAEHVFLDLSTDYPSTDIVAFKCKLPLTLFVYVIYIPPETSNDTYESFLSHTSTLIINQPNMLILVDFNAPGVVFSLHSDFRYTTLIF
ncbi:unnamed protein product [Acanthoscelides obtectus]|uniref:Uncharacterized protein n=1 Tax=Acanthoscelides obtectus TaxID=200917 RepID=A0A9P0LAT7_ACAOB|nr:unnamed protein product [Acanthoscelides obtectus]CAK1635495.1 hypothetical protein AOBTE_LOCUS9307 [Acanthoscelides obtectus]